MIALVRICLGLLFILNVIALVVFSLARCTGSSKPHRAAVALLAVNILANALLIYALERM